MSVTWSCRPFVCSILFVSPLLFPRARRSTVITSRPVTWSSRSSVLFFCSLSPSPSLPPPPPPPFVCLFCCFVCLFVARARQSRKERKKWRRTRRTRRTRRSRKKNWRRRRRRRRSRKKKKKRRSRRSRKKKKFRPPEQTAPILTSILWVGDVSGQTASMPKQTVLIFTAPRVPTLGACYTLWCSARLQCAGMQKRLPGNDGGEESNPPLFAPSRWRQTGCERVLWCPIGVRISVVFADMMRFLFLFLFKK